MAVRPRPDISATLQRQAPLDGKELGARVLEVVAQCHELRGLDERLVPQARRVLYTWKSIFAHGEAGVPPHPDPEKATAELVWRLEVLAVACQGYQRLRKLKWEEARRRQKADLSRLRRSRPTTTGARPRGSRHAGRRTSGAGAPGDDDPHEPGGGDDRPRPDDDHVAARVAAELRAATHCGRCGSVTTQEGLTRVCASCWAAAFVAFSEAAT